MFRIYRGATFLLLAPNNVDCLAYSQRENATELVLSFWKKADGIGDLKIDRRNRVTFLFLLRLHPYRHA